MKKGYLEKCWNGVHLEEEEEEKEEEKEEFEEICESRMWQLESERR